MSTSVWRDIYIYLYIYILPGSTEKQYFTYMLPADWCYATGRPATYTYHRSFLFHQPPLRATHSAERLPCLFAVLAVVVVFAVYVPFWFRNILCTVMGLFLTLLHQPNSRVQFWFRYKPPHPSSLDAVPWDVVKIGCLRFTKFCWVGQHVNIIMKSTNSPVQRQPNPRKIRLKVEFGPRFSSTAISSPWVGIYFI